MPRTNGQPVGANALDSGQMKRAERRAKRTQKRYEDALVAVMKSAEGAIVLWHLLGRCGVNQSVMARGRKEVLYMAGRQDIGHTLLADMTRVDPDAYAEVERAMRALQRRDELDEIAARTPAASDAGKADTGTGDEE